MVNKILSGVVTGLATLVVGCSPFFIKDADYNTVMKAKIEEDVSVVISYNEDECWRYIKVKSPDRKYVEAEDYITDCDKKFNSLTHNIQSEDFGHPLMKYKNFEVLEEI